MQHTENIDKIIERIDQAFLKSKYCTAKPILIAASKTQPVEVLRRSIEAGVLHFGENRLQEALDKWPSLKEDYPDIKLHFIGALQSNKVKEAVQLFDVIETIDREKIAKAIALQFKEQNRSPLCLVQVNIGKEPQKSGLDPEEVEGFVSFCKDEAGLPIQGLMCVPPAEAPPGPYFSLMYQLKKKLKLPYLSMGMSSDFETAIRFGATHVRVGTALFGPR